ncbi:MAG: hypothetical protein J2P25_18760 [Nocardiopsaceae bacterium]|nr:hypothetical protein [Nocardiopsaceae bacterium]
MPDVGPYAPGAPNPITQNHSSPGSGGGFGGFLRHECHIPWPAANEDALREAASIWHRLAETIRDNYGPANSAAKSLTSNNEGAAIDAFETYWERFGGRKGALPLGAEACDAMSHACERYADEVAATKSKIEQAGLEVAATLAFGALGAFFTFGATEEAAAGIAAKLIDSAASAIARLGGLAAEIDGSMADAVAAALKAMAASMAAASKSASGVIGAGVAGSAGGGLGADLGVAANDSIRELTGGKLLSPSEVTRDLATGLGTGAVGGVLGELSGLSQTQLANLLKNAAGSVSDTNVQLSLQMLELSRQVEGTAGKISASVLAQAATQLIMTQQIDVGSIAQSQILDQLKRATGDKG